MNLIELDRDGDVVTLTLSRPDVRNAFGHADAAEFVSVLDALARDRTVKALILTGSGSAFSAGGDMQAMARVLEEPRAPASTRMDYRDGILRIPAALHALEIPTIAAVNGAAMGVGCDLACMCDIRIASSRAKFAQSFIKVGLISGDGGVWFLQRVVGWQRAAEMAFTGEPIDAATALRWGLVVDVVEPEQLLPSARSLAARIAANPASTLRMTKRLLREAQTASLDNVLQLSAGLQALAQASPEHAAAVKAFLERSSRK
jgi:enoyl-CoA hydratase/carnithine racemase